ncbi:MAG: hypothetical protein WBD41_02720 [Rhodococcus sp. (in: high G+C Gram-positive bacteria)]
MSSSTPNETAFRNAVETVPDEIPSLAPGEWEAAVAAALAAVAAAEADDAQTVDAAPCVDVDTGVGKTVGIDDPMVVELLDAQLPGGRVYTLPVPDGAAARVPTWGSRSVWLSVCQAAAECERGRAALRRHRIAAAAFLQGCAAHADYAESGTGRRVSVSLDTLVERSGLSIYKLERCRRVLTMLELGVEHARGKKLNRTERAAAEALYRSVHGSTPRRVQTGAPSVWGLSTPRWALALLPAPTTQRRPDTARSRPRRRSRPRTAPIVSGQVPAAAATDVTSTGCTGRSGRRSTSCAPQSSSAFFSTDLSVRKDHQARTRAGEQQQSRTRQRSLNLQRAAAELVRRIPALTSVVGSAEPRHQLRRPRHSHVGIVCDLLVSAGIDTDRWSGTDIAAALTHYGTTYGWTWPNITDMTSPVGLIAHRLSLLDWCGPSPTEHATHSRRHVGETPVAAAYRLIDARRRTVVDVSATPSGVPASAEHRRRIREAFASRNTHTSTRTEHRSPRIMDGDRSPAPHDVAHRKEHQHA